MLIIKRIGLASLAALALWANAASADQQPVYEVTITNITKGQTFTPIIVATHRASVALFELGAPASEELEILAEGGDTGPMASLLEGAGDRVGDIQSGDALLEPSQSVSFTVRANASTRFLSLAAMLIPTNDTFVALDTIRLPRSGGLVSHFANAYDAGTEANDQSCANIPGPRCGGEGVSVASGPDDEGFVYVSNGFHDLGDVDSNGFEVLSPAGYDWRNPVAKVTIRRIRTP